MLLLKEQMPNRGKKGLDDVAWRWDSQSYQEF
jgi:hypothetical protein